MENENAEAAKIAREKRDAIEADKAFAALMCCGAKLGEQLPHIVRHYTWLKEHGTVATKAEAHGIAYVIGKLGFRFTRKNGVMHVATNF